MTRALALILTGCLAAAQTAESDGQISKFATGYEFVSALAWSEDGGFLLVADAPAGKISKIDDKGTSIWRGDLRATGLAFGDKGDVYITEAPLRRVVLIDRKKKDTDILASTWEGKPLNGPRGIAATKNGHVFFTDPAFAAADLKRELPFYGIYHISPKGEMDVLARLPSRPGGVAVTKDGKMLYAALADERTVVAWQLDKNGAASEQRVFARVEGVPDGVCVAPDGNVWVAARHLEVFAPDGNKVTTWKLSEKPSQIEFGEGDLRTAFVGAGRNVYKLRLSGRAAGGTRH